MKIVNTTSVFPFCYDSIEALRRLVAIGHDTIDMAFDFCVQDKNFPFMTDEYEKWAYSIREEAERLGAVYTHSHASFCAGERGEIIDRTLRCASILGIKYMVVHPIECVPDEEKYRENGFAKVNAELIAPILEKAEKYGVTILSENLFNSSAIQVADLVAEVNSPIFGWCYDVGHAHLGGFPPEDLLNVKVPPISLHVQDNHGKGSGDEHLLPGDGNLDWGKFLRYLKQVDYKGELVLEAMMQSLQAKDEEERDRILVDLHDRARRMRDYFVGL